MEGTAHMTQALGIVPFVVLLACIAVLPLVPRTADWWGKPLHQLGVSGVEEDRNRIER